MPSPLLPPAATNLASQVRDSDVISFGERDESPKVCVALLEEAGVPVHALKTHLAYAIAEEAGKGHPTEARVVARSLSSNPPLLPALSRCARPDSSGWRVESGFYRSTVSG